jgi:2-polyprenyl-3-methyl-5-hydroxy-6-metoxy-1,4-benzoquinol methylase
MAFDFTKYRDAGALHWREMTSRSVFVFNAYQQARYQIALDALGNLSGKTIVDLGAGDGAFTSLLARCAAKVIAVDNEPKGVELARSVFKKEGLAAEFVIGSVEDIPLPTACADAVVSCDVIEHIDHYEQHIAEAARILKPGGVLVVTTPYRISEHPSPFHTREFFPGELKAFAAPYFTDISLRETHHMFWFALYSYRPKLFRGIHIGRIFVNILTLWFGVNPFLKDSSTRKKRDYYTQITLKAIKPGTLEPCASSS